MDAGMDGFIAKPVDMDQLFNIIETHRPDTGTAPDAASGPSSDLSWYGYQEALSALGSNPDLLTSVCRIFYEQTPEQLDNLKAAMTRGDRDAVKRLAHTLKGAAARICAHGCRERAAGLERSAQLDPFDIVNEKTDEVIIAFNRLREVLNAQFMFEQPADK